MLMVAECCVLQVGQEWRVAKWEGSRGRGQLPGLSTPRATCTRWGCVSHEAVAWLASGCCCLPAGREGRGRCQGASPLQPGPWPAGLLGNQESQAQLIKLWAQAVQERGGTQDLQKPRGAAVPPMEPFPHAGPRRAHLAWGPSLPQLGERSIVPSPCSSASTPSSRPDPSTPQPTGGCGGVGVGEHRVKAARGRGQAGRGRKEPLGHLTSSWRRGAIPPGPKQASLPRGSLPISPALVTCQREST